MEIKPEQVVSKTPQGIKATRSGEGLALKSHAVLTLFDGNKTVAELKQLAVDASISDAEVNESLIELRQFDYVRVLDAGVAASAAPAQADGAAESRLLNTLDFTMPMPAVPHKPGVPAKPAAHTAPVKPAVGAASAAPAAPVVANSVAAPARPALAADSGVRAQEEKAARVKLETEIRRKLAAALQPRVEEELRALLRPRLEEELRPKLIATLRPAVEAEVRTALIQELTPRVELELKARFAKVMAAQRIADQQATKSESVPAPVVPAVPAATAAALDSGFERVLVSLNMPVFSLDMAGQCTYMSPAWTQISGCAAAEAVGKHLEEFFAETDRRAIAAMLAGIAGGAATRLEQQGTLTRQGGKPLWVEISAAPLYSAGGERVGVCGAIREAAESRRMAEQSEADGVRLLLLVDQIDTGVVLEDSDGNIQQVNAALCALLALDAAPSSFAGVAVAELLERASKGFIGPEGFLHRVAEMRGAGKDSKGESFVMADGRVIEQDYLAVTAGDATVGRLWLYRDASSVQARSA